MSPVTRDLSPIHIFGDITWIKPGKVAWEWWNNLNIYGVDFKAGINNNTYKYYIDFASQQGIEYVILDEGWAVNKKADMMPVSYTHLDVYKRQVFSSPSPSTVTATVAVLRSEVVFSLAEKISLFPDFCTESQLSVFLKSQSS